MTILGADGKKRCLGGNPGKDYMTDYHDKEWGVPSHDGKHLFEMLILEGMQAGLSWDTILKKREGYRKAFYHFNPAKVAAMSDAELEAQLKNPEIIRNRLKVWAVRKNAQAFLKIQKEFGSFDSYVWKFVQGKPIKHKYHRLEDLPTTIKESDDLAKDLKKRGMSFVGSTIIYAFMQAVGLVNDHITECWRYKEKA
jgi:DNA-3-methyladenine glycosylase I